MELLIKQELAIQQKETWQNEIKLRKLLHADFIEIGRSGRTWNFQETIDGLINPQNKIRMHSEEFEVIELSKEIMLLLYKSVNFDKNDKAYYHAKRSSIWVKTDIGWQLRYHQGTPCEPFEINI